MSCNRVKKWSEVCSQVMELTKHNRYIFTKILHQSWSHFECITEIHGIYVKRVNCCQNDVRLGPLLQPVRADQAGPRAPLQYMRPLRAQDGPPLSMGQQLRLLLQLQVFHAFPRLRSVILYVHHGHVSPLLH